MTHVIGVDLGGTNIVVGTVEVDAPELHGMVRRPTPVSDGPEAVVAAIADMARESMHRCSEVLDDMEIAGVGIGAPGPPDRSRGVIVTSPNLGWRDFPLRDSVVKALGLPVSIDNDANCSVLGETWLGAGRGATLVIGVTIGTGIGGGIVVDGRLYHGASDVAGEFGHMTIDSTGRQCACGNYGCLEAYASGPAIARRAVEAARADTASRLAELAGGNLDDVTAETVYRAASEGDDVAREVVRDTARFLGTGLANLVNALNPEIIVICGGVTRAGPALFEPLRAEIRKRAFQPAVASCRVVPGDLPDTAGVFGAALSFELQRKSGR